MNYSPRISRIHWRILVSQQLLAPSAIDTHTQLRNQVIKCLSISDRGGIVAVSFHAI